MDMLAEVRAALSMAVAMPDEGGEPGPINKARSRHFVEALADRLRVMYRDDPKIAVLSKHFQGNRDRFGLNELLFDILVCRIDTTTSANGSKDLTFVTGGVVAVESEFARDSCQALYDFNKLVLCASEHKIFIGPRVRNEATFLAPLGKAAAHCGGSVLAVLVPHPGDWSPDQPVGISGYRWNAEGWSPSSMLNI